jgi:hypothetical protein
VAREVKVIRVKAGVQLAVISIDRPGKLRVNEYKITSLRKISAKTYHIASLADFAFEREVEASLADPKVGADAGSEVDFGPPGGVACMSNTVTRSRVSIGVGSETVAR